MTTLGLVATLHGTAVAAGVPHAPALAVGLDLAAILAGIALYVSLAGLGGRTGPLRSLAVPFGAGLAVLALSVVVGAFHDGAIDPKTGLPDRALSVVWGAVVGIAEAGLAACVLASLRPLTLHRRRRGTLVTWMVFLGLVVVTALTVAGRPLNQTPPSPLMAPVYIAAVLAGVALTVRQGWIADVESRLRWRAGGLALGLAVTLAALLFVQLSDLGLMRVGDGTGAVSAVPYAMVLSRSLSSMLVIPTVFGALYGLAVTLSLLFGLSSATLQDQRAGERRALRSLADLSGRLLDRGELATAVARGPVEAGLGDAAWVALTDPANGQIRPVVVAASGLALDVAARATDADALYRAAAEAGAPVVLAHAESDHRVRSRPGDGVASLVALPLGGMAGGPGGLTRGVLMVSRTTSDAFEPDALAALETFAGQAALSLSHADLFADALERERLARELALAREVQQRLFPQSLPDIDGLQLAAAERPAREVGGDYYDVVRLGDDCVGVMVADVSGKGTPAAFYMAELKGIFQAGSRLTRSPGALLVGANDALTPSLGRGVFASAAYAIVDAEKGTLALARAGHTPAVLVRDGARADGGRWLLRGDGLAIGLDRQGDVFRATLHEQSLRLAPGDTLLLYTDGLTEARDAAGDEYGYDRLAAFVERHAHVGALDLRDLLLAEARSWAGTDEPDDDTTFVVLHWTGRGEDVPVADITAGPPVTDRLWVQGDG